MSTPTDLTPRVAALETDDTTLQTLSGTLDQRVTTLEGSNTDLDARVTKLEADFTDLQAKYDALQTRVATLEGNAGTTPVTPVSSNASTFTDGTSNAFVPQS